MSNSKTGGMFIFSSPSGAGKTTLVKKLSKNKNFSVSISHTTRLPRDGDIDYYFINKNRFKKLIKQKEFLEHAKVFDHYYGSSRDLVIKKLQSGKNVVFDIDWQGTRQIRNKGLKFRLFTIFILPPSKKELLKRLIKREKKNMKTVTKRMKSFKRDLSKWREYDFVVINDDLRKCYNKIIKAIQNNYMSSFNRKLINRHIKKLLK
jgi:guanylate kinase